MPKVKKTDLFDLIQRMSKSEKRRFKLHAQTSNGDEKLFVQLFDVIEKMSTFDESQILKKLPRLKKSQLPNMKAHLLKHLLINLRHLHIPSKLDIEIRDLMDFARVYYSKGMYRPALQTLDKAKKIAQAHEMNTAYFNCVEFEKKIESQHITGSMHQKAEDLSTKVEQALLQVNYNNQLSNLALRLYGNYLKHSHVKDKHEAEDLKKRFESALPDVSFDALDFYGKLYYLQCHVWYCFSAQDFANYFRYAMRWVNHYEAHPVMIKMETAMYLKGYHNMLNAYFTHNKYSKFADAYKRFDDFKIKYESELDINCQQLVENIEWIHGVNRFFLNADFTEGAKYIDYLVKEKNHSIREWNLHRRLTIYYKIACIYFVNGRFEDAIEYLNIICNTVYPAFRDDLQCFARILNLICHYDLGNLVLLKYQVKSVYRFLWKLEEMQGVQLAVFDFLRKIPNMKEHQLEKAFKNLMQKLKKIRGNKYERRAFLYLDIIAWLTSKLERKNLMVVMKEQLKSSKTFRER